MQAGSIHLLQSTALQGSTTHQQVPNRGPITRGHVPGIAPSNHHLAEPAVKSPKRIGAASCLVRIRRLLTPHWLQGAQGKSRLTDSLKQPMSAATSTPTRSTLSILDELTAPGGKNVLRKDKLSSKVSLRAKRELQGMIHTELEPFVTTADDQAIFRRFYQGVEELHHIKRSDIENIRQTVKHRRAIWENRDSGRAISENRDSKKARALGDRLLDCMTGIDGSPPPMRLGYEQRPFEALDIAQERTLVDHFVGHMPPAVPQAAQQLCRAIADRLDSCEPAEFGRLQTTLQPEIKARGYPRLLDALLQPIDAGMDCVKAYRLAARTLDKLWPDANFGKGPAGNIMRFLVATDAKLRGPGRDDIDRESMLAGAIMAFKHDECHDWLREEGSVVNYQRLSYAVGDRPEIAKALEEAWLWAARPVHGSFQITG